MKLLSFHYHLRISMDAPIRGHRFTLRFTPQSDARQRIRNLQHYIFPSDFISSSRDQWGNALLYGCCRAAHASFEANVCGEAVTGMADSVPSPDPVREQLFCCSTALTRPDAKLRSLAEAAKRNSTRGSAEAVMLAVHDALVYTPGITGVETGAAEALALGRGVCQDYAQIMLAVLRAQGIPCRYAAGMLLGEGKSHAWVEYLDGGHWYALDPTGCCTVTDQHIKLSHGRDSADCSINRGIFLGIAGQTTDISAIVTEIQ